MVLIALAALCVLTVPLLGGNLARLADIRLRGLWLPVAALALQVVITVIATGGSPVAHRVLHILTYAMIGLFLWANRRLPGMRIIATGALLNAATIVANGGIMPASATAARLSGLTMGAGFRNSTPLAHPVLPWLGDIIPWPGPLPNVLSVGDLIIFTGTIVLLQRTCARGAPRPIKLAPPPEPGLE